MDTRHQQALALEARAATASSLAEAQALHDAADRLRGSRRGNAWLGFARLPLYRN
ncbi:hypothetical protein [Sphingomonas sp. G-3-2-10]|jgi:hypothetical protein|uniref:hypothetical protein n=1 Tax=Sphingomonas sp. G-3-2-10 TaxID=2728838 RepID=UPI001469FB64|nr:hypothetical protein [Sphingomonas sp. G-3-2-10]NML05127.1 hypothetical protein [Sphingomonas sp. G-3-2-10]